MKSSITKETFERKWTEFLLVQVRGNEQYEVTRLTSILYGHLYRHNQYAKASGRDDFYEASDFWSSKRPYGNKDIPLSIAYSLGWDKHRELWDAPFSTPLFVEQVAMGLHELVLKEITRQEAFITSVLEEKIHQTKKGE